MKASLTKIWISKLLVAGVCTLLAAPCFAQGGGGGYTVVLDVAKVFKENARFDTAMKGIQQEAEAMKNDIQGQQEGLKNEATKVMETYKPGTPEFQREETRLEQQQAALRTKARQLNEELLNKEAKLYYDTYMQMQNVVAKLADEHNITMVLRFDSSQVDQDNRPDVIKAVNRGVVFQKELDITDMVIQQMGPSASIMKNKN